MEEEHAHLEWNHSTGVSKHPSRQFFSRLCSRRSNLQEGNIESLPAPTLTLSRTHSIFSPRLNVIFNVRFKYTPLWCSDSRVERFANVHEASSFFLLFFLFDEESWLIRTYHDSRLGRRTAINAGSTHTEPFYARSLA